MNSKNTSLSRYFQRSEPLVLTAELVLPDGAPLQEGGDEALILVRRREGERLFPLLEQELMALRGRAILSIDCRNIAIMDISFADECFGKLTRRRIAKEYPDRYFVLERVGEELKANLQSLCNSREIVLVQYATEASFDVPPDILGGLGAEMKETYLQACEQGRITARSLIERVGEHRLSIAACSNRLKRLTELGLLAAVEEEIIEGGGRQKVFAPVR